MGKINKGAKCSVSGCEKQAIRSVSAEKANTAGLNIGNIRRAYLCEGHYKELKKKLKKERKIEKWRWSI
ncbi:MAG: hypothetical protein OEZ25_07640 [Candidatus Bathyarchaeota archaeon]|nr:hypothetical protein [Candidatus Bathyarchaeota archaeon]